MSKRKYRGKSGGLHSDRADISLIALTITVLGCDFVIMFDVYECTMILPRYSNLLNQSRASTFLSQSFS